MNSDCDNSLASALRGRQAAILAAWQDLVLASFPEQTAKFLKQEADGFKNPLGSRIREGTMAVVEKLANLRPARESAEALDMLVRIRAVQGQPASQALEFIFALKQAVRAVTEDSLNDASSREVDRQIDALALVAFDAYMRCREQILQIRVREAQRRAHTLLSRFAPVLEAEEGTRDEPAIEAPQACGGEGGARQ